MFRVLSANLWNGAAKPGPLAHCLRALAIDIAVFQEITPEQAAAVADVLPHGQMQPLRNRHGMGIAARREIRVHRVPLPYRDAWAADLRLDSGDEARVVNLHLKAPHDGAPWRTVVQRRRQLGALIEFVRASLDRPLVLAGDFNSTPVWPAYRRLHALLRDAAVDFHARHGGRPGRTWGPWHGAPRLLRIDHVFVHRLHPTSFRVVDIDGADHSAVVADLRPE